MAISTVKRDAMKEFGSLAAIAKPSKVEVEVVKAFLLGDDDARSMSKQQRRGIRGDGRQPPSSISASPLTDEPPTRVWGKGEGDLWPVSRTNAVALRACM
jgi:hypothetical protein